VEKGVQKIRKGLQNQSRTSDDLKRVSLEGGGGKIARNGHQAPMNNTRKNKIGVRRSGVHTRRAMGTGPEDDKMWKGGP